MCIGNIKGGDDALGPYIANKLKEDFDVIDCGIVPENYTSVVKQKKPKKLIIIDAINMNLEPGEIRIVPKEKIGIFHISTHGIPISVLIKYLEQFVKNIIFIGIQPKTMIGKMTFDIKKSADKLVRILKNNKIDILKILE
jgi:hydrogenase 3 maturation protease